MSAFAIFAIIITICYVIYYAAIITIDMNAKPKDSHEDSEIIDNDGEDITENDESDECDETDTGTDDDDTATAIEWKEENNENQDDELARLFSVYDKPEAVTSEETNQDITDDEHNEDHNEEPPYSDTSINDEEEYGNDDGNYGNDDTNTDLSMQEDDSAEGISEEVLANEVETTASDEDSDSQESSENGATVETTPEEAPSIIPHQIIDEDDDIVYEDPAKQEDMPLFADPEPEYDITDEYGDDDKEPSEKVKNTISSLEPIEAESKNGMMSKEYMESLQDSELINAIMGNLNNIVTESSIGKL